MKTHDEKIKELLLQIETLYFSGDLDTAVDLKKRVIELVTNAPIDESPYGAMIRTSCKNTLNYGDSNDKADIQES